MFLISCKLIRICLQLTYPRLSKLEEIFNLWLLLSIPQENSSDLHNLFASISWYKFCLLLQKGVYEVKLWPVCRATRPWPLFDESSNVWLSAFKVNKTGDRSKPPELSEQAIVRVFWHSGSNLQTFQMFVVNSPDFTL